MLDDRKKNILKAVVDDYIATAEPVGSKALVSKFHFPVSSATVRNEMAELEEMGFLEQPHTSAGRVPSDKGYRAYVDSLLQVEALPDDEAEKIRAYMRDSLGELTGLIRKAASVLSERTGYPSLALSPQLRRSHLQQVKMLMIEPGRALVVVVLSAGVVKDRLVRIPDILDAKQLMQISSAIEEGLSGMTLDDITLVTVATAAKNAPLPESLLNQVLYEAYVAIKQADNLEIYIDGTHKLLSYPEFYDIHKAKDYLDTLARDGIIAGYMSEMKEQDPDVCRPFTGHTGNPADSEDNADRQSSGGASSGHTGQPTYMIRIGQEIMLDGLKDCSFVTTTYKMGDVVAGRIGVIGPRRMAYGRVISHIGFVKQTINDQFRRLARGEDNVEE
ncbi:MAG: heat-inducible transcriptional repressor HrcA [Clostridiaceae bacterium]|nr:heat-inducible transcriptional repressor HrcA [Clostridiaceae bacterium]